MGKGFLHGNGGGTSLNFKVVAYATEEKLKAATPKENTIGVVTTTAITSWAFSADAPSSPKSGMVWFAVGTSSVTEFNALKKNGIQVYPLSAKQYVGGVWVAKTAKSYQGGEWVPWNLILLSNSNLHVDVTGGWEGSSAITFTEQSDGTFCIARATTGAYDPVNTVNKIDVTNYNTAVLVQKSASLASSTSIIANGTLFADNTTTGFEEIKLDISELTGKVYIELSVAQGHNAYIEEVRLEV